MVANGGARAAVQQKADDRVMLIDHCVHERGVAEDRHLLVDEGAVIEEERRHIGLPNSAALCSAVAPASRTAEAPHPI